MIKKTVQYFTPENLRLGQSATSEQIITFLEEFRNLYAEIYRSNQMANESIQSKVPPKQSKKKSSPSKLISLKISEELLSAFRKKAEKSGIPYQTQIKRLMDKWIRQTKG